MRKAVVTFLVVLAGLCLAASALAESGTKDECVAKTKEVAKMVLDKGVEAATAELNKKDGKFVWKDTYVFMMGLDGKMLFLLATAKLNQAERRAAVASIAGRLTEVFPGHAPAVRVVPFSVPSRLGIEEADTAIAPWIA